MLAESGWIDMDPAFPYHGLKLRTARAHDKADRITEIRLPEKDQFATEIDHMAQRVAAGIQPHTPGEEGLQDIRIIEAIYRAAREGKAVELPAVSKKDATRGPAPATA